jgi:hypothetical protein
MRTHANSASARDRGERFFSGLASPASAWFSFRTNRSGALRPGGLSRGADRGGGRDSATGGVVWDLLRGSAAGAPHAADAGGNDVCGGPAARSCTRGRRRRTAPHVGWSGLRARLRGLPRSVRSYSGARPCPSARSSASACGTPLRSAWPARSSGSRRQEERAHVRGQGRGARGHVARGPRREGRPRSRDAVRARSLAPQEVMGARIDGSFVPVETVGREVIVDAPMRHTCSSRIAWRRAPGAHRHAPSRRERGLRAHPEHRGRPQHVLAWRQRGARAGGIVTQLGGAIEVESTTSGGSSFRVLLPACTLASRSGSPPPSDVDRVVGQERRPSG